MVDQSEFLNVFHQPNQPSLESRYVRPIICRKEQYRKPYRKFSMLNQSIKRLEAKQPQIKGASLVTEPVVESQ